MQKLTWRSSNMLKLVFFITVVRLLLLTSCLTMTAAVSKRGNIQMCGRILTQTLSLICEGQYYDPGEQNVISKRDVSQQPTDDVFSGWYLGFPSQKINQVNPHPYPQYLPQNPPQFQYNHRMERGVVDECCKKSCSLAVLMSYCRST